MFRALAGGDLAAANAVSPVPLSAYCASPEWRAVWQMRWRQVEEEPSVSTVRVTINPGNVPSYRLASHYGFVEVGEQWDDEDGLEFVYEVAAGQS